LGTETIAAPAAHVTPAPSGNVQPPPLQPHLLQQQYGPTALGFLAVVITKREDV